MNYSQNLDSSVINILEDANIPDDLKQKINDYLEDNLSTITPPKIDDEIIYHYTSPSGLNGIIEKHEIWASNVAYLNDSREFYEALDRIDEFSDEMRFSLNTLQFIDSIMREKIKDPQQISQKMIENFSEEAIEASIKKIAKTEEKQRKIRSKIESKEEKIKAALNQVFESFKQVFQLGLDDDMFNDLLNSKPYQLFYDYIDKIDDFLNTKKDKDYYVSCFTHNCDQLSQWRGYGSYAVVGFETDKLINNLVPDVKGVKIVYDQKEQEEKVRTLLDMLLSEFSDKIRYRDISNDIKQSLIETIFEIDKIYLNQYLILFKDYGFSEEEERRLYLSVTRDETDKYEIRERNGIFFPYVKLKMPSKKDEKPTPLPIKEIYLSPRTPEEFERAKIGLQYLLKKNGHKLKEEDNVSGVEIKPSSIPLRI